MKPILIKEPVYKILGHEEELKEKIEDKTLRYSTTLRTIKQLENPIQEDDDPFSESNLFALLRKQNPTSKSSFLPIEIYDPMIDIEDPH